MTDTSALRAFLEARLAEDETAARAAGWHRYEFHDPEIMAPGNGSLVAVAERDYHGRHIARHDPARVLREVAAKRRIVEMADEASSLDAQVECEFGTSRRDEAVDPYVGDVILLALASAWSEHSDYRPEWGAL